MTAKYMLDPGIKTKNLHDNEGEGLGVFACEMMRIGKMLPFDQDGNPKFEIGFEQDWVEDSFHMFLFFDDKKDAMRFKLAWRKQEDV